MLAELLMASPVQNKFKVQTIQIINDLLFSFQCQPKLLFSLIILKLDVLYSLNENMFCSKEIIC